MKKLRIFAVYGIIILLCGAVLAGYLIKNKSKDISAVGYVDKSEAEKKTHIKSLINAAGTLPGENPVVGIGKGKNYAEVTKKAIENAGGLKDIVKRGSVVLIKPNICTFVTEKNACQITNYKVVQEVVKEVYACGASKVIIAEGTISGDNIFDSSYTKDNQYNKIKDVTLVNLNAFGKKDCYELKPNKSLTGKALFIPKIYMDADVVIDIAKLKTHDQTGVSLSLKNVFGVTPTEMYGTAFRGGLHDMGLDQSIIDLNRIRRPDFAVIDGIIGGEGSGPILNTPVKSNVVFAGKDLVALDTVGLTFMEFKLDMVSHVELAGKEKLGISDLKKIKVVGADIKSIKMDFESLYKF